MKNGNVKLKGNFLFLLSLFSKFFYIVGEQIPDSKLVKIWGPGLQPHVIVMPARYFFIQAGDNFNSSVSEKSLQVVIEGGTKQNRPCRIWSNILDRKDGSFIVRYKVYDVCSHISISVKYENKHVGDSPYKINEIVYSDDCNCPEENVNKLLDLWECKEVPSQVLKGFKSFKKINWNNMRSKIVKQFDKPHSVSLCHYIIKDNKIYRKCYGKYVGFNMFSDSILLSLTRKVKLPDLELFVNLGDWPLSQNNMPEKYPIFSWCGSTEANDIVMPTYELTESALENMGRVMLDMLSVQGNVDDVWEKREPKLFWRGRDSNRHRLDLITLSRKHPDLFNVSLTNFFFYLDEEKTYGPKTEHVSFFRFFDYKYQLAIDGTVAPYRMPLLLGGGSLVFKPHSKYYEYYYDDLIPNTHYIPVETDLSDLIEKIHWAIDHDEEAKTIAQNGQKFANEHLLPKDIFCYYVHLLNELSKVQTSDVRVLDGMEHVKQKKEVSCDCSIVRETSKDEL